MKTQALRLFILLSVVLVLITTAYSSLVWAADGTSSANSVSMLEEVKKCQEASPTKSYDECQQNVIDMYKQISGNSYDGCKEAKANFTTASGKLDPGIENLKMGMRCTNCRGKKSSGLPNYCLDKEDRRATHRSYSEMVQERRSSTQKSSKNKIQALRMCPVVSDDYVDKLKEAVDSTEEKVNDLQTQIEEAEQSITDATNKMREAKSDMDLAIKEANAELTKSEREYRKNFSDELKDKRKLYDSKDLEISDLMFEREKETQKKIEGLKAIDRDCYNRALEDLNNHLKERRAKLDASQLSVKSIGKLFSTAGRMSTEKNERYATESYNRCMTKDKNHTHQVESINNAYVMALGRIQAGIESARKEQMKIMMEISGDETQRRFREELEEIYSIHNMAVSAAQDKANNTSIEQQGIIAAKTKLIERLRADLRNKQLDLTNREAVYGVADDMAVGGSEDSGSDFINNFSSLTTAAESVYSECCDTEDKYKTNATTCKKALSVRCAITSDHADSGLEKCAEFNFHSIKKGVAR